MWNRTSQMNILLARASENHKTICLDIQETDKVISMYWSAKLRDKQKANIMSVARILPFIIVNLKSLILS